MSKIFFIVLIIGLLLLGIGLAVIFYYSNYLAEKHPDLSIFFEGVIEPEQLSTTPIELLEGDKLTITIVSYLSSQKLFFSLDGPQNSTLIETFVSGSFAFPFVTNSTGTYFINLGNFGTSSENVLGFITEDPVIDEEFILSISLGYFTGSGLIFVGSILVIISFVILFFQKKRSKKIKMEK